MTDILNNRGQRILRPRMRERRHALRQAFPAIHAAFRVHRFRHAVAAQNQQIARIEGLLLFAIHAFVADAERQAADIAPFRDAVPPPNERRD